MNEDSALREENERLRRDLAEAEEALNAIKGGQVDAIVVDGAEGTQVFSLDGAERVYRVLVETMNEAGLTVSLEGDILFCNQRFCELMKVKPTEMLGRRLNGFIPAEQQQEASRLLADAQLGPVQRRIVLRASDGTDVPVQAAAHLLEAGSTPSVCVVAADLTDLEASHRFIRQLREHQETMEKAEAELRASRTAALNLMEDALLARKEAELAQTALRQSEAESRAIASENERLYRQQLNIAENLQFALLNIPSEIGRVRLGHTYRSATEAARVGGDFYDVFAFKEGKIGVLVGDVSGHGIQAARTATLVKDVVHAFVHQTQKTEEVLAQTNLLLVEKELTGFVTLFFGLLDVVTGDLKYSSAAHPETILRRKTGETELLGMNSYPLGVLADATWRSAEVGLRAGDTLLLYTDGITEARRDGEMFGVERLERMLKRHSGPVDLLPKLIVDEVTRFSGGSLEDDAAILALGFTGID